MRDAANLRGGPAWEELEMDLCVWFALSFLPLEGDGGAVEAAERGSAGSPRLEVVGGGAEEFTGFPPAPQPTQPLLFPTAPPPQGITTYFSGNCTMEDAKLAQDFLDSQVWGLGNWGSGVGVLLALTPTPGSPRGTGILGSWGGEDGNPCLKVSLA